MTWFAHKCWYCGLKSREVNFLVSSWEMHERQGQSPFQCKDRDACEVRRQERVPQHALLGVAGQQSRPRSVIEQRNRTSANLRQSVWEATQYQTYDQIREFVDAVLREVESDEP